MAVFLHWKRKCSFLFGAGWTLATRTLNACLEASAGMYSYIHIRRNAFVIHTSVGPTLFYGLRAPPPSFVRLWAQLYYISGPPEGKKSCLISFFAFISGKGKLHLAGVLAGKIVFRLGA